MAETLRDLVVSLSLNTDNFTRNIRSVQRQIQEAQSEFQLAASGIRNFEQTTEGLTAKFTSLERTLSLQADAVGQYEKALTAARDRLQECYDRQNEYSQRLQDARQKQAELAEQVQWNAFCKRIHVDHLSFGEVITHNRAFLAPIYEAIASDERLIVSWNPEKAKWG